MAQTTYKHLTCNTEQDVVVLTITKHRIDDAEMVEELREELVQAVGQPGAPKVVVDFKNITDLSSMAFRPLLTLRRRLTETNGRLILCSLSEAITDVFRTARMISPTGELTALFEVEQDAVAAVDRLSRP